MRTLTKLLIPVTAAALLMAAPAGAAPARNATLGPGALTYTWDSIGSGVLGLQDAMDALGCVPIVHDCDDTLIEVKLPGRLTITTSSSDPAAVDTDLQVFAADSSGNTTEELQESAAATPTPNESVAVEIEPGFYVARVDYAVAANGTVQGEAKLEPMIPAATATVKKPKSKNVKKFSGNVEGEAAKIEIGLLQIGKGGKCKELTSTAGRFSNAAGCDKPGTWVLAKGTKAWSLSLKKKLKKGKYVVFARATDGAGLEQTEFGATSRRAFTVKK